MTTTQTRKNKITLSDYNFQKDIENRLFLSELTRFEISVLRELIDNTPNTTVDRLAKELGVSLKQIEPSIEKFKKIELITCEERKIKVDKELRKYFEVHLKKFEEDFNPNLDFLKAILGKVPIHVLPNWYAIPRSTDHIFASIVEKYLITPKAYKRYLDELLFEDPILNNLYLDIYNAPDFTLSKKAALEKYDLTPKQLTEYALELEFNLICCSSVRETEEGYEEVFTLFDEWKEHLNYQLTSQPTSLIETDKITRYHPHDFGFVQDMTAIVQHLKIEPIDFALETLDPALIQKILPHAPLLLEKENHIKNVLWMMEELQLIIIGKTLTFGPQADFWLETSTIDQALIVYRHPSRTFRLLDMKKITHTEKDIRETERNMRRLATSGWVFFDDYLNSFTAPIGNHPSVSLVKKGKLWRYARPEYTEEDKSLIEAIVFGHLFETGILKIGEYRGKKCIALTPFGIETLFGD